MATTVLVKVRCSELVTCICPTCYKQRKLNEINKYSRQNREKCKQLVIDFLSNRNNYYSVREIADFINYEYQIVNNTIRQLAEDNQLEFIHANKGVDSRRVKCYAIKE